MQEITIHSIHNHYVKHWVKLKSSSSYREHQKTLLLEGKSSIVDVCKQYEAIHLILLESTKAPSYLYYRSLVRVSESVMKKISSLESPEGWIAELPLPEQKIPHSSQKILALDAIADPGNLGALIRSCLALGWDGIYFLENCCDPFNDKALRASKGATFFLPFQKGTLKELQKIAEEKKMKILAADLKGAHPEFYSKKDPLIMILGNESQGISDAVRCLALPICIPISAQSESLNVAIAGSILMYALSPLCHPR